MSIKFKVLIVVFAILSLLGYRLWRYHFYHTKAGLTSVQMEEVKRVIIKFRHLCGSYPQELSFVVRGSNKGCAEAKLPEDALLKKIPLDAWGSQLQYENNASGVFLKSFGADSKTGGSANDKDLVIKLPN